MKKVKIFIGSSIEELKDDRIAIGNFFRQLNDLYLDSGLYFQLVMCEDYEDALSLDGKQSQYDREIMDSALSVFIFYRKVGEYTEHEFSVAYRQFKAELRPKILTVFKCSSENSGVEDGAKAFADRLDKELKHYYKIYYNVDSLKLWLIMQIKTMGLDQSKVEFAGGRVLINGEAVANYEQAPAFSKHESLLERKAAFRRLNEEYLRLRAAYLEDDENIDLYVQYSTVAKSRAEAEEAIKATEKEIVEQLENIYTATEKGGLSARQTQGYRLIEAGRYKEALEILDRDEIYSEVEDNERAYQTGAVMMELARKNLETNVNELLQRIKILSMQGITTAVAEEMDGLYQKACGLCIKYGFGRRTFTKYAAFLSRQRREREAYDFLKTVEDAYIQGASFEEKARFFLWLGRTAGRIGEGALKREYTLKALKFAEGLCIAEETKENKSLLSNVLYTLSSQISAFGREKAYEYASRVVQICEELYDEDPTKNGQMLAVAYQGKASLEKDKEKKWEAYLRSYGIMEKRIYEQNATDDEKEAGVYLSCDIAKIIGGGFEEGSVKRKLMKNAYLWAEELAQKNPAAHNEAYASTLRRFAVTLANGTKEVDLAKKLFTLACKTYRKLLSQNEWLYLYGYAKTQDEFAEYCYNTADENYLELFASAEKCWERLSELESDPSKKAYYLYLAGSIYLYRLKPKERGFALYAQAKEIYQALPDSEANRKTVALMEKDIEKFSADSLE